MAKTLPSTVSSVGSIPDWGAKILHASRPKHQNIKQKQNCTNYCLPNTVQGLPPWISGWTATCQRRGPGFNPWSGKIPPGAEKLNLFPTATEPAHLEPVLCSVRRPHPPQLANVLRKAQRSPHPPQLANVLRKAQRSPHPPQLANVLRKTQRSQKQLNR